MNVSASLVLYLVKFNVICATISWKDWITFKSPDVIADQTFIKGIVVATTATTAHLEIPIVNTRIESSYLKTHDVLTPKRKHAELEHENHLQTTRPAILEPSTRLSADESGFEATTQALQANFQVFEVEGDGACLFRAVAHQVYGNQEKHATVRQECMAYVESHPDEYKYHVVAESFVARELPDGITYAMLEAMETEDLFRTYLQVKKAPCVYGDHIELNALIQLYQRPIEVYVRSTKGVFYQRSKLTDQYETADPIRLLLVYPECDVLGHYNPIDIRILF